jgi:hypothetical protein
MRALLTDATPATQSLTHAICISDAVCSSSPSSPASAATVRMLWESQVGSAVLATPLIIDLSADGVPDVVLCGVRGYVEALRGVNGRKITESGEHGDARWPFAFSPVSSPVRTPSQQAGMIRVFVWFSLCGFCCAAAPLLFVYCISAMHLSVSVSVSVFVSVPLVTLGVVLDKSLPLSGERERTRENARKRKKNGEREDGSSVCMRERESM